jgi:hypothetical protein
MPNQLSEDKELVVFSENKEVRAGIRQWCKEQTQALGREVTLTEFYQMLARKELNKTRKRDGRQLLPLPVLGEMRRQRRAA